MKQVEINGRKFIHVVGVSMRNNSDCTMCTFMNVACPRLEGSVICNTLTPAGNKGSSFFIDDTPEAIAELVSIRLEGWL